MNAADEYRKIRRGNPRLPARHALAVARMNLAAVGFWNFDPYGPEVLSAEWSADGYAFRSSVVYDFDPDTSWLGEFTDDPTDAIPNPGAGHREYAYFRPGNPGAGTYPYLRAAGWTRDAARRECARLDREAMELAREPEFYGVTVTASLMGRELGSASLWGCSDDDHRYPYLADVARDLASEAAREADRAIARKLGTAAEVIA